MKTFCILFSLLFLAWDCAWADEIYTFNCRDSTLQGHINYAVVGSYDFSFKGCSGSLTYDPRRGTITSVHTIVKVNSLISNCPFCNRVALSRHLLNAKAFPYMSYQGRYFAPVGAKEVVRGHLQVHGTTRNLKSWFSLKQSSPGQLTLTGQWVLRRHDYHIIWNKLLDHGGLVVGQIVWINWVVHAHKE